MNKYFKILLLFTIAVSFIFACNNFTMRFYDKDGGEVLKDARGNKDTNFDMILGIFN